MALQHLWLPEKMKRPPRMSRRHSNNLRPRIRQARLSLDGTKRDTQGHHQKNIQRLISPLPDTCQQVPVQVLVGIGSFSFHG